jgi:hypothetical protein
MRRIVLVVLAACEVAEPTPTPVVPVTPDAAPAPLDGPPVAVDVNCFVNGPKELQRLRTDPATMTGAYYRMTTGPVPDRHIRYRLQPDGPGSFALVFTGYEHNDYKRMWNARPERPRERLVLDKSVIARVFLRGSQSYLVGVEVDLHTGMQVQYPGHEAPCDPRR